VLRQNADADLPCRNADDAGESDRSLTTSDTKTRSLNQATAVRASANTIEILRPVERLDVLPRRMVRIPMKLPGHSEMMSPGVGCLAG
jgi:hypothetical protein